MENEFSKVMSQKGDADLLLIVNEKRTDYQPEAVKAAEEELIRRNLSFEQMEVVKKENTADIKMQEAKANESLDIGVKILTLIFPFRGFIGGLRYETGGYDRKARELSRWALYGFGVYVTIIILILMLKDI